MYDENNEEVSVDKDEIENLDGEFKAKLQKQQVLNSIKNIYYKKYRYAVLKEGEKLSAALFRR